MLPSTRTSIGETGTVAIDDACPAEEVVGATADASQVHLMKEQCIVVDEEDRVVRPGSKLECASPCGTRRLHSLTSLTCGAGHLNSNIKQGLLHRAFSVFLFNSEGQLLLQKRSAKKITFPEQWANTCCRCAASARAPVARAPPCRLTPAARHPHAWFPATRCITRPRWRPRTSWA